MQRKELEITTVMLLSFVREAVSPPLPSSHGTPLLLSLPFFQTEKMASSAISICFNDHVNASLSPMCV